MHKKHLIISLKKPILLAYISCALGFHCDIPYMLTMYLGQIHPGHHSPSSPSLLKIISAFYCHINIQSTLAKFTFLHSLLPPTSSSIYFLTGPVIQSCPSF
jgi:hypothetical protein